MAAATFVGRLGPLAATLGIGLAVMSGGTGVATADSVTRDPSPTSDRSGQPPTAGVTRGSRDPGARGAMVRSGPRPSAGVAARPTSAPPAASPVEAPVHDSVRRGDSARRDRLVRKGAKNSAARTAESSVPQQVSAQAATANPISGFFAGLTAFFNNQTPRLNPAQLAQGPTGVVTGLLNAVDPDSPRLSYTITADPSHGVAALSPEGTWTYTPDVAVAAGVTDSFRVTVSDAPSGFAIHGLAGLINLLSFGLLGSRGDSSTSPVTVIVAPFTPANRAPVLSSPVVGTPNAVTGVVNGSVSATDADGDVLTYSAPASTAKGAIIINAGTGAFTYTPTVAARDTAAAPGATPADRADGFTVTVIDGRGGTATAAVTVAISPTPDPSAPLAAFPGAEGFGAYATGGRDGSVIYVTNLNAAGPGSLQWAIDQPGARYILFKVSGLIDTQIHLTNGDVTIAGQTSPGGITIRGLVTDETPYQDQTVRAPEDFAENWILQHIRIRPGATGPADDGLRLRYTRNAIVDHVSIGNAVDEAIEISYSNNITVQNTLLAETVGGHAFYGGILMNYSNPAYGFGLDNVSLHHNVFNRIEGRLPEGSRESAAAANSFMNLELSNNLYWDPRFFIALGVDTAVAGGQPIYWRLNAVNNFFRTANGFQFGMFDDQILNVARNELFVSGNKMNLYLSRSDYELFYCCNDYPAETGPDATSRRAQSRMTRHPFPTITYTPTDQLRTVLLNTAGAWPRDPMDTRLMSFVAAETLSAAPTDTNPAGDGLLPAFTGPAPVAPTDTDGDGMPDAWEIVKGTNPTVANTNARTLSSVGYTDLEVYLNELSTSRITGTV
ncbi:MAG: Ig-like domain-containing protein [Mycobacterium sp.]